MRGELYSLQYAMSQDLMYSISHPREPETEEKPQKSLNEKQQVSAAGMNDMYYLLNVFFISLLIFYHFESLIALSSCLFLFTFVVQENQDLLIRCITQNLGFSNGKPVAACVIYKCLLHRRSFEVERTSVFDRIIQIIASALEVTLIPMDFIVVLIVITVVKILMPDVLSLQKTSSEAGFIWWFWGIYTLLKVQDNRDVLAYWLSNSSTLLLLLQHTLKASGAASFTPQRWRATSASLFGRMSQVWTSPFILNLIYCSIYDHAIFVILIIILGVAHTSPKCWNTISEWANSW